MGSAAIARPVKHESGVEEKAPTKREKELREAVERVYRRYGTDLGAFYRDAHRDARRDAEKRAR